MPKKKEVVEIKEEEEEENVSQEEVPVPVAKKEEKPKKKLSEKQLEVLRQGREKARLRREEIKRDAYLKNTTALLKEAKEIKNATHQKETEKIEKDFDDARKELF